MAESEAASGETRVLDREADGSCCFRSFLHVDVLDGRSWAINLKNAVYWLLSQSNHPFAKYLLKEQFRKT